MNDKLIGNNKNMNQELINFICNAWELLLKSRMLQNNEEIYYTNKPNRTILLSYCITHIFTLSLLV